MRISIICVGKIKERFYTDACAEYVKRLSKYTRLDIVELPDEKTYENASDTMVDAILNKEAGRILDKVPDQAYVYATAIEGRTLDSVRFARSIETLMTGGNSHIVFIIGGSLGLHDSVKRRANELISFSAMTFPHQLMRVILLEQIYRAFRIINNEPYHK